MKLKFLRKTQEVPDVYSFVFEPGKKLSWNAGQFLFYTLPHKNPDERGITRYFTISNAPFEKNVRITTRIVNDSSTFKKRLMKLEPGDLVEATDPDGDFIVDPPASQARALRAGAGKKYIFIAGGIGITPYRAILVDLNFRNKPINATLLYSGRDENFVFQKELEDLAKINENPESILSGFKIKYFVSPRHIEWEDVNHELQATKAKPDIYVSGPEPMVEIFGEMLKKNGVAESRIKQDFFPGYEAD